MNVADVLRISILGLECVLAIISRLFSVVKFESIIHEYDPWFNYRATRYLLEHGWYEFLNWFDERAWYPLGRVVGGTVFPGLMITSNVIHWVLKSMLCLPTDIRHICVFLAPCFSALTVLATYGLAKEVTENETVSLLAGLFMGIAPGYISRSVAGSYDNEGISIFLMMITFYFWIRAVKQGSALQGCFTAFFYFYMVLAWGGYVFIINLIPLHVFVLILMNRYSSKIYTAYSTFYVLGTLSSMLVPFVGYNPSRTSDHMAALGIFGLVQIVEIFRNIRQLVTPAQFKKIMVWSGIIGCGLFCGLLGLLQRFNMIAPWTGRFYSLWDTSYAKKHIPIIASVSEHQPTVWTSFFLDLHLLAFLFPAGLYFCIEHLTDESIFVMIFAITSSYFAGVMVRLMLTLTPVVCVVSAMALGKLIQKHVQTDVEKKQSKGTEKSDQSKPKEKEETRHLDGLNLATVLVAGMLMCLFVRHCTWTTHMAYSSPSVVLSSQDQQGNLVIIDDFREAYYWLRKNTPEDTKVMSWWDYGYQIAGFSDRITIVDNNTWNNTHIATVGLAFASDEERAYRILRDLDVDYVLVLCGAVSGYSGDDINKFLWMVRIAQGEFPDLVREEDFYTDSGQYRVDDGATDAMKKSLMYKLSYYRMEDIMGGNPVDRVRRVRLPKKGPELKYFEESFSSERYIVRLYRLKHPDVLGRSCVEVDDFNKLV